MSKLINSNICKNLHKDIIIDGSLSIALQMTVSKEGMSFIMESLTQYFFYMDSLNQLLTCD